MPYGNRTPYYKKCPVCKKEFKLAFWELKTKKTCSFECSKKYKKLLVVNMTEQKKKEISIKISKLKKGKFLKENSSQWKGEKATYESIHEWVRKNYSIPEKCEHCNEVKKLDAANVSKKYKRIKSDWKWLCRKCHNLFDGKDSAYFRKIGKLKNKII